MAQTGRRWIQDNAVNVDKMQLAASNPGLEGDGTGDNGLQAKLKADGGILVDSDGLYLDHTKINAMKVEQHTVTAGEITAKGLTLGATPAADAEVTMDIVSGVAQNNGVDFSVSGTALSWNGLGLDGVIAENDVMILAYPI